jgi:hypothetical protein
MHLSLYYYNIFQHSSFFSALINSNSCSSDTSTISSAAQRSVDHISGHKTTCIIRQMGTFRSYLPPARDTRRQVSTPETSCARLAVGLTSHTQRHHSPKHTGVKQEARQLHIPMSLGRHTQAITIQQQRRLIHCPRDT